MTKVKFMDDMKTLPYVTNIKKNSENRIIYLLVKLHLLQLRFYTLLS